MAGIRIFPAACPFLSCPGCFVRRCGAATLALAHTIATGSACALIPAMERPARSATAEHAERRQALPRIERRRKAALPEPPGCMGQAHPGTTPGSARQVSRFQPGSRRQARAGAANGQGRTGQVAAKFFSVFCFTKTSCEPRVFQVAAFFLLLLAVLSAPANVHSG